MSGMEDLESRRQEFENHVWNHAEDAFQLEFDVRQRVTQSQVNQISEIVQALSDEASEEELVGLLRRHMTADGRFVYILMQLVGLTRNKIIQDLKGALASTGISIPVRADLLHRRPEVWEYAGPYLVNRIRSVFIHLISVPTRNLEDSLEALNQATWPGWIRQERAKRQGHEAEHRLAVLLASLEIPFQPEAKAENPLCPDSQIDGVSYDLVVPNVGQAGLCFKATVHTANIGQYGESKDDLEIREAKQSLSKRTDKAVLMAMIDGVGFRSNRAGLDGVLKNADEFCQFKTIWKAAVVAASVIGVQIELLIPDASVHAEFLERYKGTTRLSKSNLRHQVGWAEAGEGLVRIVR